MRKPAKFRWWLVKPTAGLVYYLQVGEPTVARKPIQMTLVDQHNNSIKEITDEMVRAFSLSADNIDVSCLVLDRPKGPGHVCHPTKFLHI